MHDCPRRRDRAVRYVCAVPARAGHLPSAVRSGCSRRSRNARRNGGNVAAGGRAWPTARSCWRTRRRCKADRRRAGADRPSALRCRAGSNARRPQQRRKPAQRIRYRLSRSRDRRFQQQAVLRDDGRTAAAPAGASCRDAVRERRKCDRAAWRWAAVTPRTSAPAPVASTRPARDMGESRAWCDARRTLSRAVGARCRRHGRRLQGARPRTR